MFRRSFICSCFVLSAVLATISPAENCRLSDRGEDHLWSNPANWEYGKIPTSNDTFLSTPYYAQRVDWSLYELVIDDGIDAICKNAKNMNQLLMTITGGSLTVLNEWKISQDNGIGVQIDMSGGEVEVGNYVDLGGWSSGGSCGTLNMTEGFFSVGGQLKMGTWGTTSSYLNLHGGIVTARTLSIGPGPTHIDITEGKLVLSYNVAGQIGNFVNHGIITGYGGEGEVVYDYDVSMPGKTTITAVPEPGSLLLFAAGLCLTRRRRRG